MTPARFPLLYQGNKKRGPQDPLSIPWDAIAPHEPQALRNHDQSLKVLASRGGLSPFEAWCVMKGYRPSEKGKDWERSCAEALEFIKGLG